MYTSNKKRTILLGAIAMMATSLIAQTNNDSLKHKSIYTVTEYDSMSVYLRDQHLQEVDVIYQAPAVKLKTDKVTYQVENDADAKTRTVLEMLRKVPMVTVDGRNNITVNGSSQFKVYVDGRLNTLITRNPSQMLRNMPASNVKNIEVITNPGAQYDAEGAGGVLCITTKKKDRKQQPVDFDMDDDEAMMSGPVTNGSVHATGGMKNWGLDASLSHQNGRWSYDLNLNGEYMYTKESEVEMETTGSNTRQYSVQRSTSKMPFTMAETGLGFEIDSISSLHANVSLMWFGMNDKGTPSYLYSGGAWGGGQSFSGQQTSDMNDVSVDGSLDYQRQWGEKGRLLVNYQLSHGPSRNDMENIYDSPLLPSNHSEVREKSNSHQFTTDVTIPLGKNQLLTTGSKLTTERSESNSRELLPDGNTFAINEAASIHYRQHQYIAALYAEWDAKWGWFSLKNGYRYEHTWQDSRYLKGEGSDFRVNYGDLVPSLSLTASIGEVQNLGLNYNLRIRRPRISELDPYVNKSDPTQLSYGNPHLDAQHLHHLAGVYTLTAQKVALSLSLRHAWSNDAISQYSKLVDNTIHSTYGNVAQNRNTSLNVYASWSISGATRLLLNGEAGYADMRSPKIDAHNYGWHGNANVGLQQTLPWQIKWNTNLEWMSRRHTLQGYSGSMTMMSTSLARSFCNDRWNISLSGTTGLGHGGKMVWKSVTHTKDFTCSMIYRDTMQDVMLGVTYTFGRSSGRHFDNPMPSTGGDMDMDSSSGRSAMRRRR